MAISSREVIKRLKKEGWVLVHIVGSHHHYKHANKRGRVTVPHPKKDLTRQTLSSICGQAGWDRWDPNWKKNRRTRGILCSGITQLLFTKNQIVTTL